MLRWLFYETRRSAGGSRAKGAREKRKRLAENLSPEEVRRNIRSMTKTMVVAVIILGIIVGLVWGFTLFGVIFVAICGVGAWVVTAYQELQRTSGIH